MERILLFPNMFLKNMDMEKIKLPPFLTVAIPNLYRPPFIAHVQIYFGFISVCGIEYKKDTMPSIAVI